jgi:hypothetical protein
MKKLFAIAALGLFSFSAAHAQQNDKMLFNHLAVGITTGTPGLIGFDVATTCTPYLQIRAGLAIMPKFKYSTSIKLNATDVNKFNNDINNVNTALAAASLAPITERVANEYDIQGKLGFTNGKILIDFFPFKSTGFPFFITVGAYFGGTQIISVYNKVDGALQVVNQANAAIIATKPYAATYGIDPSLKPIFAEVGEYKLGPNAQGNATFDIKVNGFKPYLGIGFGRPFPKKHRIGFSAEIGCIFWSKPTVTYSGYDDMGNTNITIDKNKAGDKDVGKAIDVISKFSVWPCINFRLTGKIF